MSQQQEQEITNIINKLKINEWFSQPCLINLIKQTNGDQVEIFGNVLNTIQKLLNRNLQEELTVPKLEELLNIFQYFLRHHFQLTKQEMNKSNTESGMNMNSIYQKNSLEVVVQNFPGLAFLCLHDIVLSQLKQDQNQPTLIIDLLSSNEKDLQFQYHIKILEILQTCAGYFLSSYYFQKIDERITKLIDDLTNKKKEIENNQNQPQFNSVAPEPVQRSESAIVTIETKDFPQQNEKSRSDFDLHSHTLQLPKQEKEKIEENTKESEKKLENEMNTSIETEETKSQPNAKKDQGKFDSIYVYFADASKEVFPADSSLTVEQLVQEVMNKRKLEGEHNLVANFKSKDFLMKVLNPSLISKLKESHFRKIVILSKLQVLPKESLMKKYFDDQITFFIQPKVEIVNAILPPLPHETIPILEKLDVNLKLSSILKNLCKKYKVSDDQYGLFLLVLNSSFDEEFIQSSYWNSFNNKLGFIYNNNKDGPDRIVIDKASCFEEIKFDDSGDFHIDDYLIQSLKLGYWLRPVHKLKLSHYLNNIIFTENSLLKFQPKPIRINLTYWDAAKQDNIRTQVLVDCTIKCGILIDEFCNSFRIPKVNMIGNLFYIEYEMEEKKTKKIDEFSEEIKQLVPLEKHLNLMDLQIKENSTLRLIVFEKERMEYKYEPIIPNPKSKQARIFDDSVYFWNEVPHAGDTNLVLQGKDEADKDRKNFELAIEKRKVLNLNKKEQELFDFFFKIKAASLNRLIEMLTNENYYSKFFAKTMICSLPMITQDEEFFIGKLKERYHFPAQITSTIQEREKVQYYVMLLLKKFVKYKYKNNLQVSTTVSNDILRFIRNIFMLHPKAEFRTSGCEIELLLMKLQKGLLYEPETLNMKKSTSDNSIETSTKQSSKSQAQHSKSNSQDLSKNQSKISHSQSDNESHSNSNNKPQNEETKDILSVAVSLLGKYVPFKDDFPSIEENLRDTAKKLQNEKANFSLAKIFVTEIGSRIESTDDDAEMSDYSDLSLVDDDDGMGDQTKKSNDQLITPFPLGKTKQFSILRVNITEFCKQLTLISFSNFRRIKIHEFFFTRWTKHKNPKNQDEMSSAKNVISIIEKFNIIADWVSLSILREFNLDKRAKVLSAFIKMAHYLHSIGNYHDVMGIVSGLQSSAVYRLANTWKNVPQKLLQHFKSLDELTSVDHFKSLREEYRNSTGPIVPYLGVYLSDFTMLEEISNRLKDNLVNFSKLRRFYTSYYQIAQFQKTPYNFPFNETVHKLVTSIPNQKVDEQVFWDLSTKIEPLNF
ncbi:guanine nucleotide exchange factor [Anaeramoeba ignava]|uniref:Guanine nucleotide exchange factor n=1 Tax=Anaeramoeba ignava TaxID=1746090 RepID=A0A9Q0LF68_ANAIG|nr:guanine nucleotide exchange factor [Anaeramoeba ignava]